MTDAAIISADRISKKFRLFATRRDKVKEMLHPFRRIYHEPFCALHDVSFEIPRGQSVGVAGRNGSGKSTLMQILANVMQPTSGVVSVGGRVAALLQLGAGFNPEFTGRENALLNGVLAGLTEAEVQEHLPWIEWFADLGKFFDQPVGTYSSGMYVRLGFAVATAVLPDVLIVDEALSVGDAGFHLRCFDRIRELRERGGNLVLVSHDKYQLTRHCERGLLLENGRLVFDGPMNDAVNRYDAMLYAGHPGADAGKVGTPAGQAEATATLSRRRFFNPQHYRMGDARVVLTDYRVLDESGVEISQLRSGMRVRLVCSFHVADRIARPSFGMALCAHDGVVLYGTNTHARQIDHPALAGGTDVDVEFQFHLPLLKGIYNINIGLFDASSGEPQYADVRRGIVQFEIPDADGCQGMIDLGCTINVNRRGDA